MKLQPVSKTEIRRIVLGTLIGDGLLSVMVLLLTGGSALPRYLLYMAAGSAIAVGSFVLLCLTIQSVLSLDRQRMQLRFQLSYTLRMLLQAGWAVASMLAGPVEFLAGAGPLLFPRITLLFCRRQAAREKEE